MNPFLPYTVMSQETLGRHAHTDTNQWTQWKKCAPNVCCVCFRCKSDDRLLSCASEKCEVRVHPACYDIRMPAEDGAWYCDLCAYRRDIAASRSEVDHTLQESTAVANPADPEATQRCVLCPSPIGAFCRADDIPGAWVHPTCAKSFDETSARTVEQPATHLEQIPVRAWQLSCAYCNSDPAFESGACVTCAERGCTVTFHATCSPYVFPWQQGLGAPINNAVKPAYSHFCKKHYYGGVQPSKIQWWRNWVDQRSAIPVETSRMHLRAESILEAAYRLHATEQRSKRRRCLINAQRQQARAQCGQWTYMQQRLVLRMRNMAVNTAPMMQNTRDLLRELGNEDRHDAMLRSNGMDVTTRHPKRVIGLMEIEAEHYPHPWMRPAPAAKKPRTTKSSPFDKVTSSRMTGSYTGRHRLIKRKRSTAEHQEQDCSQANGYALAAEPIWQRAFKRARTLVTRTVADCLSLGQSYYARPFASSALEAPTGSTGCLSAPAPRPELDTLPTSELSPQVAAVAPPSPLHVSLQASSSALVSPPSPIQLAASSPSPNPSHVPSPSPVLPPSPGALSSPAASPALPPASPPAATISSAPASSPTLAPLVISDSPPPTTHALHSVDQDVVQHQEQQQLQPLLTQVDSVPAAHVEASAMQSLAARSDILEAGPTAAELSSGTATPEAAGHHHAQHLLPMVADPPAPSGMAMLPKDTQGQLDQIVEGSSNGERDATPPSDHAVEVTQQANTGAPQPMDTSGGRGAGHNPAGNGSAAQAMVGNEAAPGPSDALDADGRDAAMTATQQPTDLEHATPSPRNSTPKRRKSTAHRRHSVHAPLLSARSSSTICATCKSLGDQTVPESPSVRRSTRIRNTHKGEKHSEPGMVTWGAVCKQCRRPLV